MKDLLVKACEGWGRVISPGKLTALLLVSLLFLWMYPARIKQKSILIYSTISAVCCICPLTAAVLMLYQTMFYDYVWIWSIVPLTAMTAYAVTLFLTELLPERVQKGGARFAAGALLAVTLVFCGGMGEKPFEDPCGAEERASAERVLAAVQERVGSREMLLWAPEEIVEYAREYDGAIRVLYGRDMWNPSLNGYDYDIYEPRLQNAYRWMAKVSGKVDPAWETEDITAAECARTAREYGVSCILLPRGIPPADRLEFEEQLNGKAEEIEDYYLFIR